jgi:hypothetical protein
MYVVEHQPAGAVCSSMFHGWNLTDPLHLLVLPTCVVCGKELRRSHHGMGISAQRCPCQCHGCCTFIPSCCVWALMMMMTHQLDERFALAPRTSGDG